MRNNFLTTAFQQISNNWRVKRTSPTTHIRGSEPHPRLMFVLAHPDDEALCVGGTIAKYAQQGTQVALVVATRGERGWRGRVEDNPGLRRVGLLREQELRSAARELGVYSVEFLDYLDGQVDDAPFEEVVAKIARVIRRFRPDVVVTFDPHGMYGHPDHIAISQATTNAVLLAADRDDGHRVAKLYYRVYADAALEAYQGVFGSLKMRVGDTERGATGWREWSITTQVAVQELTKVVWRAIACHKSQLELGEPLRARFFVEHAATLGNESYYRVFSRVYCGREMEMDLFQGIRVNLRKFAVLPQEQFV